MIKIIFSIFLLVISSFFIVTDCSAIETKYLVHKEGNIVERPTDYNPNQDSTSFLINKENIIEIAEVNELKDDYLNQYSDIKKLANLKKEMFKIKDKLKKKIINNKEYQKINNKLSEEVKQYDIALIKSIKMPYIHPDNQEEHLSLVGKYSIGFPNNLIKKYEGDPFYIQFDYKNNLVVWSYFAWSEKLIGYKQYKIGEETKTTGQINLIPASSINWDEKSKTKDIYNILAVYQVIKIRKDFYFNPSTGRLEDLSQWYEYSW